jgi:hypothetical protein
LLYSEYPPNFEITVVTPTSEPCGPSTRLSLLKSISPVSKVQRSITADQKVSRDADVEAVKEVPVPPPPLTLSTVGGGDTRVCTIRYGENLFLDDPKPVCISIPY